MSFYTISFTRIASKSPRSLSQCRFYSSNPSLITSESYDAPHCGTIKILKLDRPEARNAISKKLLNDLKAEIDSLKLFPSDGKGAERDSVRALIIASNVDGVFCAGADLKERLTFTIDETRDFLSTLRSTLSSITALPIPTISAINGSALGGGLELALTTTFRVAASTAKLGLPETRLAIIPGGGGTHRLPQLIGRQRAMYMVLTGRAISAHEAEQMGLCDRMVMAGGVEQAREGVLKEARELAEEILRGGPVAIGQGLKAVRGFGDHGKTEEEAYEVVLQTEDRLAALKAFREKGIAKYQGR